MRCKRRQTLLFGRKRETERFPCLTRDAAAASPVITRSCDSMKRRGTSRRKQLLPHISCSHRRLANDVVTEGISHRRSINADAQQEKLHSLPEAFTGTRGRLAATGDARVRDRDASRGDMQAAKPPSRLPVICIQGARVQALTSCPCLASRDTRFPMQRQRPSSSGAAARVPLVTRHEFSDTSAATNAPTKRGAKADARVKVKGKRESLLLFSTERHSRTDA